MRKDQEIICGIYKFASPSGKVYIGSSMNIWKRYREHKHSPQTEKDYKLINSFRKHGFEKHLFKIIHVCEEVELNKWEIHFGSLFQVNDKNKGLNLRECGGNRGRHSEESKKKVSDKKRGIPGKPHSEESKEERRIWAIENNSVRFMAEWIKENGSPMKGRTHAEDSNEKNRIAHLGGVPWNKGLTGIYDADTIELMRVGGVRGGQKNKGKTHTDEARKNMSDSHIGQVAWNKGLVGDERMKHTEEWKKGQSERAKGNTYAIGVKHSQESKRKRRDWNEAHYSNIENRKNMSYSVALSWIKRKQKKFEQEVELFNTMQHAN